MKPPGKGGTASGLAPRGPSFLHSLVPLPEPAGNVVRESMAELTGEHDDLASVMALMCDEVRQDVRDVQRQVAPDVGLRWRHMASCSDAELEQRFNPFTAPLEGGKQFMPRDLAAVDRCGDRDPVFLAESLEPACNASCADARRSCGPCAAGLRESGRPRGQLAGAPRGRP